MGSRAARAAVVIATQNEAAGAGMRVAGLTVIERALRQLARLGHAPIVVASDGSVPLPPLPGDATVRHVADHEELQTVCGDHGDAILVRADVVMPRADDATVRMRVADEPSRRRAEDAVFAALLRPDLGFVARYLNKPISFRITRHLLCRLPATPNQVTLAAAAIGLGGCGLIATGGYAATLIGFLLAHAQSVLDGCDGELARVRFQQSPGGEWLDTMVDDMLNLALVAAVGLGLRGAGGTPADLALAALTCLLFVASDMILYRALTRQGDGGEAIKLRWWFSRRRPLKTYCGRGSSGPLAALIQLGRRDLFVFVWLVLAAFDLTKSILISALILGVVSFVGAAGQLVADRACAPPSVG